MTDLQRFEAACNLRGWIKNPEGYAWKRPDQDGLVAAFDDGVFMVFHWSEKQCWTGVYRGKIVDDALAALDECYPVAPVVTFTKAPEGGYVVEGPNGTVTQGDTLLEAAKNLVEALTLLENA